MPSRAVLKPIRATCGLAALLALAALASLPMPAAAQGLGKAAFQDALVGAMTDRNLRNVTLQGEQLAMQELTGVSPQGAFAVNVISACEMLGSGNSVSNQAGKVMRYQNRAVVANTASNFQFALVSQAVQPHQRERVEKALVERLATLNGEYRDLRAEIRRQEGGSYQLVAQHDYGSEPAGTVRSRIGAALGNARFMVCDIHTAMELADHERWKALRKSPLGQVDRGTFITLYPLLKEPGYELKGETAHGTWGFKLASDLTAQVENHGHEMKAWVYVRVQPVPDAAGVAAMHARLQALKPSHGAARIESLNPTADGWVWVALVFPYARMTGDDFADTLKDLINDKELLDFRKAVQRAVAG